MSHYVWKLQYVLFRRIDSIGVRTFTYYHLNIHKNYIYSKLEYVHLHYPYISAFLSLHTHIALKQKLEQLTPPEFSMPIPIPPQKKTYKKIIESLQLQTNPSINCLQGFQPGGLLRLPVFLGENLSLTQGEAHECRSGTQHLWHLGGIPKNPPVLGPPDLGVGGNLSKTKRGGLPVDCRRRLYRFRGEVRFGEKLICFSENDGKFSGILFGGFNKNWGQTFRSFTPQVEKRLSSARNHNDLCSTQSYYQTYQTWNDKFWIFVTLGPKKVTQSPKMDIYR